MSYMTYEPSAHYAAIIDAALGAKKNQSDFQDESDWKLYLKTYGERKLTYGHKYMTTFLRQDAAKIAAYEQSEKLYYEQYELGLAVANLTAEVPDEEFLSSLPKGQRQVYTLGLFKGANLKKFPQHFPAMLEQAVAAAAANLA